MKRRNMFTVLYIGFVALLSLYSYALIDPNLTLINHPLWEQFREPMVQLGYHNRPLSWSIYLVLILLMWVSHFFVMRRYKRIHPVRIALLIGCITLFSYPFLSHDFFNYIFDARMLTHYGDNPYTHTALDYPEDARLRFMHWVHRPYPYGPTFLPLTLIPSFLSLGKFIAEYFLFKALFLVVYLLGVSYLFKQSRKSALEFATHPFVILEGLINLHNDMLAVSFAFIGLYYLSQNKTVRSHLFLFLSGGIKYLTMPLVMLRSMRLDKWTYAVLAMQMGLFGYLLWSKGFQQWYFFLFFALLPLFPRIIQLLNPLFLGLLLSYYPYIRLGGWDTTEKVFFKDQIIYVSIGITLVSLLVQFYRFRYAKSQKRD